MFLAALTDGFDARLRYLAMLLLLCIPAGFLSSYWIFSGVYSSVIDIRSEQGTCSRCFCLSAADKTSTCPLVRPVVMHKFHPSISPALYGVVGVSAGAYLQCTHGEGREYTPD